MTEKKNAANRNLLKDRLKLRISKKKTAGNVDKILFKKKKIIRQKSIEKKSAHKNDKSIKKIFFKKRNCSNSKSKFR